MNTETLDAIRRSLDFSERLLADPKVAVIAATLEELGDIALPDSRTTLADSIIMRFAGPLYLVSELAAAGLLDTVDTMAALAHSGAFATPSRQTATLLYELWQHRHEHPTRAERNAIFSRAFGQANDRKPNAATVNGDFESRLIDLIEALAHVRSGVLNELDTWSQSLWSPTADLAENVTDHLAGVPPLAVRSLVNLAHRAVTILGQPDLRALLRAPTDWEVLGAAQRRFGLAGGSLREHGEKGRAGQAILTWTSASLPAAIRQAPLPFPPRPILAAAVTWASAAVQLSDTPAA